MRLHFQVLVQGQLDNGESVLVLIVVAGSRHEVYLRIHLPCHQAQFHKTNSLYKQQAPDPLTKEIQCKPLLLASLSHTILVENCTGGTSQVALRNQ